MSVPTLSGSRLLTKISRFIFYPSPLHSHFLLSYGSLNVCFLDAATQILMHDLDEKAAKKFYRGNTFAGPRATTKSTGVQALFPQAKLDDFVFDPCGYSVNGIVDERYYFTIHVVRAPCAHRSAFNLAPLLFLFL